ISFNQIGVVSMEQAIKRLKEEIEALKRDYFYVKNQVSSSVLQTAIELREKQIKELEAKGKETVKLSCREEDEGAFELAITQLGYRITDSTWDDEKEMMYYTAER